MSTAIERIKELTTKLADVRKEIGNQGKALFTEAAAEIFANHPKLAAFSWTQYAPYFNDGDSCTFRARTDHPHLLMKGKERVEDEDGLGGYGDNFSTLSIRSYDSTLKTYVNKPVEEYTDRDRAGFAVLGLLGLLDDETYELLFTSDGRVVVTPEGITIEDYGHD